MTAASTLRVIGVDPGPIPGVVVLTFTAERRLLAADPIQCTARLLPGILSWLLTDRSPTMVAVEAFVVGHRAARSSTPHAGSVTRQAITEVHRVSGFAGVPVLQRSAVQVKPWATDARLDAAGVDGGLLEATKGMRHARDAARHALFAAVHDGGFPDPLSKNGATP